MFRDFFLVSQAPEIRLSRQPFSLQHHEIHSRGKYGHTAPHEQTADTAFLFREPSAGIRLSPCETAAFLPSGASAPSEQCFPRAVEGHLEMLRALFRCRQRRAFSWRDGIIQLRPVYFCFRSRTMRLVLVPTSLLEMPQQLLVLVNF